jgi:two-component system chemotaxis response regulator CheB
MAPSRHTRILIVDDSAVMCRLLRAVIAADAELEIVGTAGDGATALAFLERHRPDLILLDVEMPVMDGLVTLKQLRRHGHKMPVIMCSSLTQSGARVTIEALASGASDYVAKPAGQTSREEAIQALAQELLPKIHALTATAPPQPLLPPAVRPICPVAVEAETQPIGAPVSLVAIGVSTGGPAALDQLLPALPSGFPLPVLIVQHMPEVFTGPFAERLNRRCAVRVQEAREGDAVQPGSILIARGGWHMEVAALGRPGAPPSIHLTQDPPENHCRPAADVLFRSAAKVYGSGVLGVVLTGMGSDGLAGCRLIRGQGGGVIAQDQATSTVWGMPGAVIQARLANRVLPLPAIAPEIVRIAGRAAAPAEARERARMAV